MVKKELIVFRPSLSEKLRFETPSRVRYLVSNPLKESQGDLLKRLEHGQVVECLCASAKGNNFVVKINKVIDQYTNRVIESCINS